ncbi:molybdopterin-dependent oxidoreductase [Geodermatophilus sp. YIM 151500]|uniref:xanthine dehydrogenase family protein molybdopterin-binding subunit n=1 Tax=Geodermatophilus sp. YIM 151500 TaxID=2984531 RepID=UPI0021E3E944|nr:molybdopterin cofactor-binding domain-containing protein [Geodermatophilus sp. YIM 151500]MCV2488860.1 molybdopterin-dependent oxidoreductase [Geodermatophilus sp. YIM 151500]
MSGEPPGAAAPALPGGLPAQYSSFGGSLRSNPLLSRWLRFVPGGRVRVLVGKVELGQGIRTALGQIAAEELDVDWSSIEVLPAGTDSSPDEAFTAGSRSVMDSGGALRAVCAQARALLLSVASDRSGIPAAELGVRDGAVRDRAGTEHGSYWTLLGPGRLEVPVTGEAPAKDPADHTVVGRSLPRTDLPAKLTGAPAFVSDLALPGQLFGRVVRPPSPGACLLAVDDSAARALPAVVGVVRRGSFLGVVADREEEAVRAAELLRASATWREEDGLPEAATWLRDLPGRPAERIPVVRHGEPVAPERVAAVVRERYGRPHLAHASIGPGCALARWDDGGVEGGVEGGDDGGVEGGVEVWTHSQGVYPLREALSASLDLPADRIVVHHADGPGCYGHNSADDVAYDAVVLARAVPGRPVQVQWSRDDEFAWEPYAPAMVTEITVGVDAAGDPLSWEQHCWSTGHDSRPGFAGQPGLLGGWHAADVPAVVASDPPLAVGGGTARNAVPPYAVDHVDVQAHRVTDMPLRTSALRGLGATVNVLAIESMVDELAARADVDPLEYRLRHLRDERGRAVLETVAERAGWVTRSTPDAVGWGLGYSRYKDVCAYCAVVARVEAVSDVRVSDLWIAVDAGQVINPDGLVNQVEGGAIQATSWALLEEVTSDRRTVTSRDWETYPVLRFGRTPRVHVTLLPRPGEPPLGAGEVAGGPVTAALANAVADAVGVRVRELPLTPERIAAVISA